jgi:DNA polymerase elongation subunit (family B)
MTHIVKGVELTDVEYDRYTALTAEIDYCESQSYAFKILQNSFYGAQLNQNFKFYAKVAGESTTGTGRHVLQHQIRKCCEVLDGDYNIDPIVDDEDPRAIRGEAASPSIIYGDTDSSILTLKHVLTGRETLQEKIKIADNIALLVNKSFPKFMMEQFLLQPEFSDKIKTGRELFASAAFFVSKKRYAMHVVDKEGIPKDDLKLMGLDAKKTTTPRPIKAFLKKCVMDVLKGVPAKELDEYIVAYRDKIIDDVPLMEIGLPKGIKKIELYTEEFRNNPRTRIPGHTSAALLYNEFRERYKDNQSLQISSGMKIKVFNFKYEFEHDGRMFKSIALPTDTEEIPQWFADDFVPLIDRITHSKKLVDNMLHNMFDSIPRHVPTRHMQAIEEEFEF